MARLQIWTERLKTFFCFNFLTFNVVGACVSIIQRSISMAATRNWMLRRTHDTLSELRWARPKSPVILHPRAPASQKKPNMLPAAALQRKHTHTQQLRRPPVVTSDLPNHILARHRTSTRGGNQQQQHYSENTHTSSSSGEHQ
jgi:hypothetical protein